MKYIFPFLAFLVFIPLKAQSTWNDNWREHFSYRNCQYVVEDEQYIVAATANGLIVYDYLSGTSQTISSPTGLSDVGISALANIGDNSFIIGYENGNIDLLINNKVTNIPDVKNKQLEGSKKINHFLLDGERVFASTDFGILVIDLDKLEISNTYFLGINSANLIVYECITDDDYLYAATDRGLLRAPINDTQISYYETWENIGNSTNTCVSVKLFNNQIIQVTLNSDDKYEISWGQPNDWTDLKSTANFKNLNLSDNSLTLSETSKITRYDTSFSVIETFSSYNYDEIGATSPNINQALYSSDKQSFVIADKNRGLVIIDSSSQSTNIPNGPYSNNCFKLFATQQGVYSLAGGLTTAYNNLERNFEYSYFDHSSWTYFRSNRKDDQASWRDAIRICDDPLNDERVYITSWGGGMFDVTPDTMINYNQFNSGLQNIDWTGSDYYVRIGGIDTDSEGNVWMSNSEVEYGMVVMEPFETPVWHQFSYETLKDLHSTDQILITKDDYVWIIIPRNIPGIMVIKTNGTLLDEDDDLYRGPVSSSSESDSRNAGQLRIWDESLNVITTKVYCLAEDDNGYIWMGTDDGVIVYYTPWSIFTENYPIASRIKIPRNDGTDQADYLLQNENVTCIAVDGANRKWVGTQTSGVYLISDDGVNTYEAFNTDNSPLPSNSISSIAIDPVSGEVFIGTSEGIVSYKGKATEGHEDFNEIYAYPNPVREDFSGDITITGLLQNSNVKITTASGKLVYETRSLGGKAYWNGRNLRGEKVKSGVYIVYVASEDGSQMETTKILIVR